MVIPFLNILSEKECKEIIHNTKPLLKPTTVVNPTDGILKLHPHRTAAGVFINETPLLIQKIQNIVADITNLPIKNQEPPQVVRYKVGGEYKEHTDFTKRENDRRYSCLFYLNEDVEGGGTYFPDLKLQINPTLGTMIMWENLYNDGTPNPHSIHTGLPVSRGEKWILVIWVHENEIISKGVSKNLK